jgi:hypothetical protein
MPVFRHSVCALVVLFAGSLAIAGPISISPPTPQSGQSFQLQIDSGWGDSCVPGNPRVLVVNKRVVIDFTLTGGGVCLPAGSPWKETIDIPPLGSGRYVLIGRLIDFDGPVILFKVNVDVAGPPNGITGVSSSFDASAGNRVVRIYGSFPCSGDPCAVPSVIFGSKPAEAVERVSASEIDAVVPAQTQVTTVDLKVQGPGYSYVLPSGFTYVSLNDFEPILVPMFTRKPIAGAYGSSWITELSFVNLSGIELDPETDIFFVSHSCDFDPCTLPLISPHAVLSLPLTMPRADSDVPPTVMLYVRRSLAPYIAAELRVRDVSRQAETWGTEIPVVRESRMSWSLALLDVPMRAGFRQMLRLYMPDYVGCCATRVQFFTNGGDLLTSRDIFLKHPDGSIGGLVPPPYIREGSRQFPLQPAYAQLDLSTVPELAGQDTVWIRAQSYAVIPLWAFVSVTNDATQHVTTITPQ